MQPIDGREGRHEKKKGRDDMKRRGGLSIWRIILECQELRSEQSCLFLKKVVWLEIISRVSTW